ncbi:uncharacterized protein LOC143019692 [Oratosquilla oratoria]|uniref:uncharacterized protein LOC143019692 n=1 Tax=Oratosquilla oratoria TaxID=337810 RepID=UPI003F7605B0
MMGNFTRFLTPEALEDYRRDGAVVLRGVFEDHWIEAVRRGIAKNLAKPSQYSEALRVKEGEGAYFNDYCNWSWIEEFSDYIFNSPAATVARFFTESPNITFYHEHVLNKEPGTSKHTPWHHDQSYYPFKGHQVCSLWMPVDPVSEECSVKFVAGSHRWPRWLFPVKFASEKRYPTKEGLQEEEKDEEGNLASYSPVPVDEIEAGKWPILKWKCEPGDVVVFHMRTVHGAKGNTSETRQRRVLSTRWLGDDARLCRRPWVVSPPITAGLVPGDPPTCSTFPAVPVGT